MAKHKRKYTKKAKGGGAMATAMKALTIANGLKMLVNVEQKLFPYAFSLSVDNVSSNCFNMVPIPVGTGNGNRIGDSLKLQSLHLQGYITKSSVPITTRVRIILFSGKSERGLGYTIFNDILEQIGTQPLIDGVKHTEAFYDTKFLMDKVYTLDTAQRNIINLEWKFKLRWHVNYETAATTIDNGGLYLAMISDQTGTSKPFVNVTYGIKYTDD